MVQLKKAVEITRQTSIKAESDSYSQANHIFNSHKPITMLT